MNTMTNETQTPIFGTDGIRGRALEGWLTPEAVEALAAAAGRVLAESGGRALIAHDGRASADPLQAALARGFASAGLTPESAGLLPTPGLAWLTAEGGMALGAMISASHNPAHDNGIKLFAGGGAKLDDDQQDRIEVLLREAADAGFPSNEGGAPSIVEAHEDAYAEHLIELALHGDPLDLSGQRVVIDCANGAASRVGPKVLKGIGAEVDVIHAAPDGENINEGCGSTATESLQARVVETGALFGVALDGDADRCLLVDERGELVDGDAIMTILARDRAERGALPGDRIVATVMSNRGLHRALEPMGVGVVEVGVGDRQVVEGLKQNGLALGGEKSGHIIFGADSGFIGDGLLTALHVLAVCARKGAKLSELSAPFQPFPQVLLGLKVASKPALETLPRFQELRTRFEQELGADGRVNVRYSGTEPKARVMVEGLDEARIGVMANELVAVLEAEIGG